MYETLYIDFLAEEGSMMDNHFDFQKLVKMCGEVLAGPFEKEEMHFLCILCAKIREDPHLVYCFIEVLSF